MLYDDDDVNLFNLDNDKFYKAPISETLSISIRQHYIIVIALVFAVYIVIVFYVTANI